MIHLINKKGSSVLLNEIGAGIVSIVVPDKNGIMGDVVLGYRDPESYRDDGPCMGKIPGRYANRIAFGRFTLNGTEYKLATNCGKHHLHGGIDGFANRDWELIQSDDQNATFRLISPDGDQGYPGKLTVTAQYNWCDDNVLTLDIKAQSDRDTVLNLTNHTYWNLAGENSGSVLDHELQLFADRWLPTDDGLIPTGEIAPVDGTPMDFRQPKTIGRDIHKDFDALKFGKGYDNCWILNDEQQDLKAGDDLKERHGQKDGQYPDDRQNPNDRHSLKKAAELFDPDSGRQLEIFTTQPAIQVYTGNWLSGSPLSKSGRSYCDYDGVAIECQHYPDAPNKDNFSSAVLRKGETFHRIIQFKLSIRK